MGKQRVRIGDDEMALLDAVHADPRDDAPRLAYADWLKEHGEDVLAHFVTWQVQCYADVGFVLSTKGLRFHSINNLKGKYDDVRTRISFEAFFLTTLPPVAEKWVRPFPRSAILSRPNVIFRRGLPRIYAAHDMIRRHEGLDLAIKRFPAHARIAYLMLWTDWFSEPAGRVFAHPVFGRTDSLYISYFENGERAAEFVAAIAESNLPERIERLMVRREAAEASPAACEAIAARTRLVISRG